MPDSTESNPEPAGPSAIPTADKPIAQQSLTTERLLLRPFQEADSDMVQDLLQCKEIAANTRTIEHPYPEGAARIWIGTHLEKWNLGHAAVFAICKQEDPKTVIGAIGLEINAQDENAELGYWIGEPFWGQGICSEAASEILKFGFTVLGLHKIHAHHLAHNEASGRVMQKIGMQKEGYLRSHMKKWGVFEDIVFYGIVTGDDLATNQK